MRKKKKSEEREAEENEKLTFVAFLSLLQPGLIVKSPVSGAELRRLIRTSLRKRRERGGKGERVERRGVEGQRGLTRQFP